jgi:hypothetical protein
MVSNNVGILAEKHHLSILKYALHINLVIIVCKDILNFSIIFFKINPLFLICFSWTLDNNITPDINLTIIHLLDFHYQFFLDV